MLIASANTGFYIGIGLGFLAVVVVVVLVGIILTYASRVADQAETAAAALAVVRDSTNALQEIHETNEHAVAILEAAKTARGALTG